MSQWLVRGAIVLVFAFIGLGSYAAWRNAQMPQPQAVEVAEPGEEKMMVYVLGKDEDNVSVIGCPAGPERGPAKYAINDPGFIVSVHRGDFVPVLYTRSDVPGEFHLAGWLSREETE